MEQGQIPEGADLRLTVEMLYGPVYYRHVLRKPAQDEATVAALVAHVLRSLSAGPLPAGSLPAGSLPAGRAPADGGSQADRGAPADGEGDGPPVGGAPAPGRVS